MTIEITGTLSGAHDRHTPESLAKSFSHAWFVAPKGVFEGRLDEMPGFVATALGTGELFPIVLFAHGSSGIGEPVKAFARYVASLGVGMVIPNSFVLEDRLAYTSPVARKDYERVHAMRSAELAWAAAHLDEIPGWDGRHVVAGTSEGGVAAARFTAPDGVPESGRMIFSWSCEDNYHVEAHRTAIPDDLPVLCVMSAADKFFSRANPWLDNPGAVGNPSVTLAKNKHAAIVLIPGAPHTLFALPQTESATLGFLARVFEL